MDDRLPPGSGEERCCSRGGAATPAGLNAAGYSTDFCNFLPKTPLALPASFARASRSPRMDLA
jgi:hypothetical protein